MYGMKVSEGAFQTAKREMLRIPVEYEYLMRVHPDSFPSLGMVAKWDRNGGFSSTVSSAVENTAMTGLTITDKQRSMLKWLDAVYEVFFRLMDTEGKNRLRVTQDRRMARLLKARVFDGLSLKDAGDQMEYGHSEQYVGRLFGRVVCLVAAEAIRRGLIREE